MDFSKYLWKISRNYFEHLYKNYIFKYFLKNFNLIKNLVIYKMFERLKFVEIVNDVKTNVLFNMFFWCWITYFNCWLKNNKKVLNWWFWSFYSLTKIKNSISFQIFQKAQLLSMLFYRKLTTFFSLIFITRNSSEYF